MPLAIIIGCMDKIISSTKFAFKNIEMISEPPTSQMSLSCD
jgi:hypothetical protein